MRRLLGFIAAVTLALGLVVAVVFPARAGHGGAHITITLPTPPSGPVGTSVTVTGAEFSPNETGISVTYDGVIVASDITANSTGTWTALNFLVPPSPRGSRTIAATRTTQPGVPVDPKPFTVSSSISLSPSSGPPGSSITVTGAGFGANEFPITVTYFLNASDSTPVASGIAANFQGAWTKIFNVPASTGGSHTIRASTPAFVTSVTFTVTPSISLSRRSAPPGTSITVTGTGFAAFEPGITVTYDGTSISSGLSADAQGGWSATFNVPAAAASNHTVGAFGSSTKDASAPPNVTFTIGPGILINRTGGPPGTSIAVAGTGFGPGEVGITVTYDGTPMVSGISANAQGAWSATFTVPPSAGGPHAITASGASTPASSLSEVTFTIGPGLSLNPRSGPPGISVTVSGTGFTANERSIAVIYDGNAVASGISANAQGVWTATFAVPASAGGPRTIIASSASTQATTVSEVTFTVSPSLSLNRSSGPPGTPITVTGAGFAANDRGINITYDNTTAASGITADAQGAWTATFAVPASAGGSHTIRASGFSTPANSVPDITFATGPAISVRPTRGSAGTSLTVTGAGFGASEPGITVTYDGTPVASGIPANAQGAWTATFTAPPSAGGSHAIAASGTSTSAASLSEVTFTIGPGLSLRRSSGLPGTSVEVTGSGFAANERGITVTYDGTPVASGIPANDKGVWTATFTVPASAGGPHAITASGASTQAAAVSGVTFTIATSLALSRGSGPPGTPITVTGSGFAASERGINILYDGTQVASGITANAQGTWTATFPVPASPVGPHAITASGTSTLATTVSEVTFTSSPGLSLSRGSGPPGTSITVTGDGFGANERGINATYDGTRVASGITANAQGAWIATFTVPASAGGSHAITASGASTSATAVSEVTFTVSPSLSLGRGSGAPGTSISINGTGFGAGEAGITVTYDAIQVASGISANAQGTWTATFTVPASPAGAHGIKASGPATQATAVPDTTFIVGATLSVSRTSGAPGTSLTVTGAGFAANERGINVTYDGTRVASGITADAQGEWSAAFTVPPSSAGSHGIKASGPATQAASVPDLAFNVISTVSATPASGHVGMKLDITGAGFVPNSNIALTYGGAEIKGGKATADGSGSFSLSITTPKSKAGDHTVKAVDGRGNESRVTFSIENTAPRAPNPLSPQNGARISLFGGITPTLKWSDTSDPSGVAYTLQLDPNPDFPGPFLERADLTASSYTLAKIEALPRGKYYWRVKAVDGASNESTWSQRVLLKSGLMPLWVLIAIVAFGVVFAGSGAFLSLGYLLRRRRRVAPVPEIRRAPAIPGYFRELGPEEPPRIPARTLPRLPRLALPGPAPRQRTFTPQEQARVKMLEEFAGSLPLIQVGYDTEWLIELVKSAASSSASNDLPEQLFQGQFSLRYEPSWKNHPLYLELRNVLEGHPQGQPLLQGLDSFIEAVNGCASESTSFLQDIYRDAVAEVPSEGIRKGQWRFVFGVYADSLGWFRGRFLREPSERDYLVASASGPGEGDGVAFWLQGVESTPFAGNLLQALDESEALEWRELHLKLRRTYRNNERAKGLVGMLAQLEVHRDRLLGALGQLSQLGETR